MRIPTKTGFSTVTTISRDATQYHLRIWRQPMHRWLIAAIYHRYDMFVFRIPGFQQLERWLTNRSRNLGYLPISCRQDIRCYQLTETHRTTLARLPISADLHRTLKLDE